MNFAQIALRAFERPLLIHPAKAQVIASVLAEHISNLSPMLDGAVLEAARHEADSARAGRHEMLNRLDGERRGPVVTNGWGDKVVQTRYLYKDGTALVTVEGSLVNRGAWIGANSGLTSYEGVKAQLVAAATDKDVRQIVLDLESPGGEAIGAFEMADFVRGIAADKTVIALVDGMAASAAYAMASGASRIVTTPSGISGSIGVVMLHLDNSKRLEKAGVTPTLIFAGGHKVDGNPFAPLPDSERAHFQAEVDQLYSMFVATVAAGRGGLTEQAIRATEARTYIGADAVKAGLADDVGSLSDLVSSFAAVGRSQRRKNMTKNAGAVDDEATFTQAEHDAALATARAAARAEGEKAGAEGERKRIAAILDGDSAKGRETLARHFAFETGMSPEDAASALEKAPAAAEKETLSPLAAAMQREPPVNLGPGGDAAPKAATDHGWGAIVEKINAGARRQ